MAKVIVCVNCGEKKDHEARGLCVACYGKIGRPLKVCVECKENKPHTAHGLCKQCYNYHRRIDNPEAVKTWNSRYYKRHREECLATSRRWAKDNSEKIAIISSRWKRKNPQKVNVTTASYRARKRNLPNTLTNAQTKLKFSVKHCFYCEQEIKLELDHFVPLGATNNQACGTTFANSVVACRSCNSTKKIKMPEEILKQLELWQ